LSATPKKLAEYLEKEPERLREKEAEKEKRRVERERKKAGGDQKRQSTFDEVGFVEESERVMEATEDAITKALAVRKDKKESGAGLKLWGDEDNSSSSDDDDEDQPQVADTPSSSTKQAATKNDDPDDLEEVQDKSKKRANEQVDPESKRPTKRRQPQ